MTWPIDARDVTLLGLAADIAGAVVLARGFMMKGVIDIYDETGTRLGRNLAMVKSAMLQRAEAWGGAVLLLSGFALQIFAALELSSGHRLFVGWWGLAILLGISGVLFAAAYAACAWVGTQHFYAWALRNYDDSAFSAPTNPHEEQELLHHGRLYGVEPTGGESLAAFAVRLSSVVSILGRKHRGRVSLPSDE